MVKIIMHALRTGNFSKRESVKNIKWATINSSVPVMYHIMEKKKVFEHFKIISEPERTSYTS
jgi:hypothetical protein